MLHGWIKDENHERIKINLTIKTDNNWHKTLHDDDEIPKLIMLSTQPINESMIIPTKISTSPAYNIAFGWSKKNSLSDQSYIFLPISFCTFNRVKKLGTFEITIWSELKPFDWY